MAKLGAKQRLTESEMSESNPIRVFATHNFQRSDDYLRIFEFLESVDRFYYLNVSKPENLPLTGGQQAMRDELIDQIKASEAVFVLTGLYDEDPDLVNFMMDAADANGKKMIAIRPFGGSEKIPQAVSGRVAEVITWNDREMVDALRQHGRGEDTARWEVVDFPGFDEDGPIE